MRYSGRVNLATLGEENVRQYGEYVSLIFEGREVIWDIQRYLAKQQYYVQMPSAVMVSVWEGALKNYSPNLGFDFGGRLTAAWLDR